MDGVHMTCTRPEWSTPDNDWCPCDASPEPACVSSETSCELCSYWQEDELWMI